MEDLPAPTVALLRDFRARVEQVLGPTLVGIYLLGSIAFPGYVPKGDIDFFIVTEEPLKPPEQKALDRMHRGLGRRHHNGDSLDGFYLSLARARSSRVPSGLAFGANGKLGHGGRDEAWPLHRAHLLAGAYIQLYGQPAKDVFGPPSRQEIERALRGEFSFAKGQMHRYPYWAVLQMCRLVYSYETRDVVVSKLGAADWALEQLPPAWHPLIRAAVRTYRGRGRRNDARVLRAEAQGFLEFISLRIRVCGGRLPLPASQGLEARPPLPPPSRQEPEGTRPLRRR